MILGLVSEVLSEKKICMNPETFIPLRNMILANIDGRIVSNFNGEKIGGGILRAEVSDGGKPIMARDMMGNAERIAYYRGLDPEDRVINLVNLTGPMTRNGAECSYGSKEIRDMIMRAADIPQVKGHIIYCDTQGGMASCVQDFRMAINYAHERGQKVFMLIDGACASGGAFTAALCDGVYYVNGEDEIGSIGMYAALFTLADGAENKITSEVYHEYYATASKDKNAWSRAAAEGDMSLIEKEIDEDLAQMIANLKADRPSILDEQCTGRMYKMKDVVGSLVDGQSDLNTLAVMLFEDHEARQGAALPAKNGAEAAVKSEDKDDDNEHIGNPDDDKPEDIPDDDIDDDDDQVEDEGSVNDEETSQTENKTSTTMTEKKFEQIAAVFGVENMESEDGSLYLTEEQADALEAHLGAFESEKQTVEERHASEMQALRDEIESLKSAHEAAMQEAQTAHEGAIAELQTKHEGEVAEMLSAHNAEIENLKSEHAAGLEGLNTQIDELSGRVEDAIAQIEQLTAQRDDLQSVVTELNDSANKKVDAGAAPSSNGQSAPKTQIVTSAVYDRKLSAEENAQRMIERRKSMGGI